MSKVDYAFMCRDEHTEIGHNDSSDDERCPVCQERARAELLGEALLLIADIAEGSTTANSLPNIARLARKAILAGPPLPAEPKTKTQESIARTHNRFSGVLENLAKR